MFYRQNQHSLARPAASSALNMSIRAATERLKTRNPSFMVIIHQRNIEKGYAVKLSIPFLCIVIYSTLANELMNCFAHSTFLPVLPPSIWVAMKKSLKFRQVPRGKNGKLSVAVRVGHRSEWRKDGKCFARKAIWELEMWLCLSLSRGARTVWWISLCFLQLQSIDWKFVVLLLGVNSTSQNMVLFWSTLGVFWALFFCKYDIWAV